MTGVIAYQGAHGRQLISGDWDSIESSSFLPGYFGAAGTPGLQFLTRITRENINRLPFVLKDVEQEPQ